MNDDTENTYLLYHAVERDDLCDVKRLLPVSNTDWSCAIALTMAAKCGHQDCVRFLIPVVQQFKSSCEFPQWCTFALNDAAEHGHVACVSLLIPFANDHQSALLYSVTRGHHQCVELLLPVSDPKAENSCALQYAIECNDLHCIALLYDLSDPMAAVEALQRKNSNTHWSAWEEFEALRKRDHLHHALGCVGSAAVARKI